MISIFNGLFLRPPPLDLRVKRAEQREENGEKQRQINSIFVFIRKVQNCQHS